VAGEIVGRKHPVGGDVDDGVQASRRDLVGHHPERLLALVGETGGGVAQNELGDAILMRQGEAERDGAAEAVAHQDGVAAYIERRERVSTAAT